MMQGLTRAAVLVANHGGAGGVTWRSIDKLPCILILCLCCVPPIRVAHTSPASAIRTHPGSVPPLPIQLKAHVHLAWHCVPQRGDSRFEGHLLVLRGGYGSEGDLSARQRSELAGVLQDPQIDHTGMEESGDEQPNMSSEKVQQMQVEERCDRLS